MSAITHRPPTRRIRAFTLAVLGCAIITLVCAAPAAALVLDMSTTELTDASATVVVAKALATDSRWTNPDGTSLANRGTIVTDVRLAVYEVLKGEAQPSVTITVPGGAVGRVSVPVEDAPRFVPGTMYVVFLAANGQVVAWREGQPQIIGARVPALGVSLAQVKASVAQRVGHPADVLRPWSGVAPRETVADPQPIELTSQTPGAPADGPTELTMKTGSFTLPQGVAPQSRAGAGTVGASRAATTLFADDFEGGSMANWTIYWPNPLFTNASRWGADWWLTDSDQLFWWAYSSRERCWWPQQNMWETQSAYSGTYTNNDSTWMIAGPFNTSSYSYGALDFDAWVDTASAGDYVGAWFSTDGSNFAGPYWYGNEGSFGDPPSFASMNVDLRNVPVPGGTQNFCGRSQVWIAFYFRADGATVDRGVCVDNVLLRGSTTPLPKITAVNPPSAPSGTYLEPTRNQSRVTISGEGFGASKGDVAFFYQDGEPLIAGKIVSWTASQIVCDVPIGIVNNYQASAGSGPVRVRTAAGEWSNAVSFDVPFASGGKDWEASRCLYRVNMDGAQQSWVDAAAQSWNNVGTQMQFQNIGACTTTPVGTGDNTHMPIDGHNDMCFDSLPFPGVIAAAWPIAVGGRVLETDICFNTTGGFSWGNAAVDPGVMDIQTIAVHEIGHWLNLRDLYGPGDTNRVMFGFCGEGVVKRNLTAGEVAGIQWIYAEHGLDTAGPVGRAKSLTVTRGRTAKVLYNLDDPKPSIGVGACKVKIKNRAGKVVKSLTTTVYTRMWNPWKFRCSLARGRYSIVVTGTDMLGHRQSRSVKGYLTVK